MPTLRLASSDFRNNTVGVDLCSHHLREQYFDRRDEQLKVASSRMPLKITWRDKPTDPRVVHDEHQTGGAEFRQELIHSSLGRHHGRACERRIDRVDCGGTLQVLGAHPPENYLAIGHWSLIESLGRQPPILARRVRRYLNCRGTRDRGGQLLRADNAEQIDIRR